TLPLFNLLLAMVSKTILAREVSKKLYKKSLVNKEKKLACCKALSSMITVKSSTRLPIKLMKKVFFNASSREILYKSRYLSNIKYKAIQNRGTKMIPCQNLGSSTISEIEKVAFSMDLRCTKNKNHATIAEK